MYTPVFINLLLTEEVVQARAKHRRASVINARQVDIIQSSLVMHPAAIV